MDPDANMREQVELASQIIARTDAPDEGADAQWLAGHAARLAELVVSLAEWRAKGGFAPEGAEPSEATYKVRRFYFDDGHPDHRKVIKTGLTLAEAQEHCNDDDSREVDATGNTVWFDGYDEEG